MPRNDAEPAGWVEMVVVGRVARAHGNRGAVIVNLETDFPEQRFQPGNLLYGNSGGRIRSLRIEASRFQNGRPVLTLAGVETIDQAESLAGVELRVPEGELVSLPPDSYYHHELTGCVVRTVAGEVVGTVTAVEGAGGVHRLFVRRSDEPDDQGDEIELPLAEPICVSVDTEHRVVVVDPPDGLLELNRRR